MLTEVVKTARALQALARREVAVRFPSTLVLGIVGLVTFNGCGGKARSQSNQVGHVDVAAGDPASGGAGVQDDTHELEVEGDLVIPLDGQTPEEWRICEVDADCVGIARQDCCDITTFPINGDFEGLAEEAIEPHLACGCPGNLVPRASTTRCEDGLCEVVPKCESAPESCEVACDTSACSLGTSCDICEPEGGGDPTLGCSSDAGAGCEGSFRVRLSCDGNDDCDLGARCVVTEGDYTVFANCGAAIDECVPPGRRTFCANDADCDGGSTCEERTLSFTSGAPALEGVMLCSN